MHTGKIDPGFSKTLHKMFLTRQEVDYKELVCLSIEGATEANRHAKEFLMELRGFIDR